MHNTIEIMYLLRSEPEVHASLWIYICKGEHLTLSPTKAHIPSHVPFPVECRASSPLLSCVFTFVCVCVFQYRFMSINLHSETMMPQYVYVFSYAKLAFCGLGKLLLPPIYGRNLPLNACQPPVQDYGGRGCYTVILDIRVSGFGRVLLPACALGPFRYRPWLHWGLLPAGMWRCVTGFSYLFIHGQFWTACLHRAKLSAVFDSWRNFLEGRNWCRCGFCEGRVYCFLVSFSNSIPLHFVVHDSIKVLHTLKHDLELSQSPLLGKLTFGVVKGVMLHYQAYTREVWG